MTSTATLDPAADNARLWHFSDSELRGKALRCDDLGNHAGAARYRAVLDHREATGTSWGPGIGPQPSATPRRLTTDPAPCPPPGSGRSPTATSSKEHDMVDSSWIKLGVEVFVYLDTFDRRHQHPRVTQITGVAKKSFKVDGIEERFELDTLKTKTRGSRYTRSSWVVVPVDSETAHDVLKRARLEQQMTKAHSAVESWLRDRHSDDKRRAAIDALGELDLS